MKCGEKESFARKGKVMNGHVLRLKASSSHPTPSLSFSSLSSSGETASA
jgi:hypothetical protein